MSNLIPTVITDRNGKITTVHRREEASRPHSSPLPAPIAPTTACPGIEDQIMGYASEQLQAYYPDRPEREAERVARQLLNYPNELLVDLEHTLRTHEVSRRVITVMLQNNMNQARIHEAAVFLPEVWSGIPNESYSHVMALEHYEELPQHENYALAGDDVRKQCIALINVSIALDGSSDVISDSPLRWKGDDLTPVIEDPALVRLVIENPDKAPMIAKFISDRFSVNHDALSDLVKADSNPLSRGFL